MLFKKVSYGSIFRSSILLLRKNLILFLPNIIMIVISFLLIMLFFYGSGISDLIFSKPFLLEDTASLMREFDKLSRTPPFIMTLFIWIVGELIFGSFFTVMKFGMIRDVIQKEKTSIVSGLKFAEKNFFNYWTIHLVSLLIIFAPVLILLFVYLLFIGTVEYVTFGAIVLSVFAISWLGYAILMAIRLFFVFPVMTFEKEKYLQSIAQEFHYVKTHLGHTFISFMIVLAVLIGYNIIRETIDFFGVSFYGGTILLVIVIIMAMFEIFVSTWEHVFIFQSYLAGKHIKELVTRAKKKGDYIPVSSKNKTTRNVK